MSKIRFLILLIIGVYTIAAAVVSVQRYRNFQSFYFDFGIFDRAIWLVSKGEPPVVDHPVFNDREKWLFADHFNPSMFVFVPVYWFSDNREFLLILQSIVVGASALVAYAIADRLLQNKIAVLALITAYLGYVGLQNALITDFHDATLLTLPLMLCFWFVLKKKWWHYLISLIIFLGLKETFAGLGVGLGVFVFAFREGSKKLGVVTILISLLWGVVATQVIIPHFNSGKYYYSTQLTKEPILNKVKFQSVFYSLLTFGFLPALYPPLFVATGENFLERFISASPTRWNLGLHYSAPLSPLLFMGSLFVILALEKKKFNRFVTLYSIFIILTVVFLHRYWLRGPLGLFYNRDFYKESRGVNILADYIEKIPRHGSIMAQNDVALRLTHTKHSIFLLDESYKVLRPDIIALNLIAEQNPNSFYPLSEDSAFKLFEAVKADPNYQIDVVNKDQYIFVKK